MSNIGTSSNSFEWIEKCYKQVHKDSQVKGNTAPEGHVASTPVQERLSCKTTKIIRINNGAFKKNKMSILKNKSQKHISIKLIIFSLPKSTASTALVFIAYSEVYLITLYLWGTSSFLDRALRQRTNVTKESIS